MRGRAPGFRVVLPHHGDNLNQHRQFPAASQPTSPISPNFLEVYRHPWDPDPCSNPQARDAENILQNGDARDFQLLCRFSLYEDVGLPMRILQGLPESRLLVLLKSFDIHADNLERDLQIKAILKWVAPKQRSPTPTQSMLYHRLAQIGKDGVDDRRSLHCREKEDT